MDLALLVYAISVLSSTGAVLLVLSFIATIVAVFSAIGYFAGYYETEINTAKYFWKYSVIVLSIITPILLFIPSEKTMYTMVGAYAVQKVAEDPKVQQLSAKVLKVVEDKLDGYIDETTKKVAK